MATFRGNTKGIDDAALKEAINKYCGSIANKAANAGLKLMEKVRSAAVRGWYNNSSGDAMNNSTIYKSKIHQNNGNYTITITSYVDINMFEAEKRSRSDRNYFKDSYSSLEQWRERHERDGWTYYNKRESHDNPTRSAIFMPYSVPEYLFVMPWMEGLRSLPLRERYTDTGWEWSSPPANAQGKPLRDHVVKRLKDEWTNKNIQKYM